MNWSGRTSCKEMNQACDSTQAKDDMAPSRSGPWCRKPLWVVEMQARGEMTAVVPASVEMAPLAGMSPGNGGAKRQGDNSADGWLENDHMPSGSGGAKRQGDNSADVWLENDDRDQLSPGRSSANAATSHHHNVSSPQRHLTLLDLLSIGIGGTVGSGIFVLCGLIAHSYAGPATTISFAISGASAAASGCAYAELASKIPVSGSTYAYAYVSIGELAAVISAALLTLEYGISGSAVARSWGDKVMESIQAGRKMGDNGSSIGQWMGDAFSESSLNPLAFALSIVATITLLSGVKESKRVVNAFTIIKLLLIAFMIIVGFVYSRQDNWTPFVPPKYGVAGVFRGSTSAFFGFLGFDEVVCLAGESVNPKRDLAPSVLLTIAGVSVIYILASLSLSGMQPYENISEASGFPEAFRSLGLNWAANIAALGEIICLPLVVLICLLAQPRLLQALSQDDLLPSRFGDLRFGTLWSGIAMAVIALCVPFTFLDDFISAGVLLAFCITNNAAVLLRNSTNTGGNFDERRFFERDVGLFNASAFLGAFLLCYSYFYAAILPTLVAALLAIRLGTSCRNIAKVQKDGNAGSFEAPIGLPFAAIFVNAALIFQLEPLGLGILFGFILLCAALYFCWTHCRDTDVKRWKR